MMAGENGRPSGGAITTINVTPLVDITLVLLIIFMVTAKLIVKHAALAVDLPKASTGQDVQEIFSIVLDARGTAQVDGATVEADDEILALARAAQATNGDLRAVIKADGDVPHRRVMHVLDLLRQAGVSRVGFGVEPVPSGAAVERR
jgi:biopolymer transport protein ExbD